MAKLYSTELVTYEASRIETGNGIYNPLGYNMEMVIFSCTKKCDSDDVHMDIHTNLHCYK